ncbi:unnamed protein product [Calicophoron daubneyi]|uniref:Uncharacterized protein n=1 Tax=Calicophoron daubneyi TaxID=300641 RepID=A0AAV2T6F9_CALDB
MLGKRGQIGRSHSTVCTKSESFDDGGNLNQCNFASMITTQEDSNSEPRFSLYETLENMASDRFISRLHTNLDCRFAMPPTLSLEMRRPTYLLAPRKTAAPSHLRTTAEDVSLSGQETKWPNPLTNSSLAYITQRFCTNFFNRYCAPLGDQCTITAEYDTCKQSELSSRDPNTVEEAGENLRLPQSSPSKTVNSGPSSPICPVFFASSLVDTMKAAERPNGRPWPVILLYLHHEESPHTQRFLSLMFYEPHEEHAKPAPTEIEKGISIPKPSGVPPGRERTVAPPASLEKTKSARNISTKRSERNSTTESSGFAKSTKSKRSSLILFKRSSIPPPGCNTADGTPNKKSASQRGYRLFHTNHGKGRRNSHVSEKNTSESTNQSTSDFSTKPLLKSGQSPVIGFSESVNESRQSTKASYYRQQLSNQNSAIESEQHRNKMNLLSESTNATSIPINSEEDAKAFETPLASETFRTVLIERTSGVVPWDCTDAAGRAYLAQAFPGTRLVQWLKQWQKPTDYPSIIAIGRTAERDVVCSRLQAYQATRLKAVRWLNDVTLAHFYNYRKPNIPICPEYSERLFQSPPKSVTPPSETHAVSCIDPPETTVAPSGVSPEGSPRSTQTSQYPRSILTTVADGEIVDHVFTSCMNTRPNTGEKSRSSALRVSPEEIIYRVIKTPQLQTGPISELFELPVNRPSERFREHLRKVQYSFKQAIAALSKSTTPEALTRLGIALPSPVIPAKLGLYRSVSSSVLIEALCKVSSTESATSNVRSNKRSATAATESNTHRADLQKKPTRNHTVVLNSSRPGSMSSPQRSRPFHSVPKASEQRVDERLLRSSAASGPRNASPGAFHSVNARIRSAESQITELKVTSGWNFYEQFCKQFIVDFPSKPSFLLGSLGTAVLRCVDVLRQQHLEHHISWPTFFVRVGLITNYSTVA